MFDTIRQFAELTSSYDCSLLTHHYLNSTPMDLQENNSNVSTLNYYTEPSICLSGGDIST